MRIVGIDPGLRACGVAILNTNEHGVSSWHTQTIRSKERMLALRVKEIADKVTEIYCTTDLLVIEKPQVYQGYLQKGDPNDLVALGLLVGALLAKPTYQHVELPLPTTWKGQIPKEIHHKRIRAQLPDLGKVSKDALDAVGLCLYGMELINARPKKR